MSEHDGSDDSNHNRRHLGLDQGGDGYRGPRTVRCAGATDADPRLGGRCGTSFMPRRTVIIGTIACPVSDGGRVVVGTYNRPVMGHLSGRAEGDELRGLNIQAPASARLPSDDTPMICDDASCDDVIFNECLDGSLDTIGLLAQILYDDPSLHEGSGNPSMPSAKPVGSSPVHVASPGTLLHDIPTGRARMPSVERLPPRAVPLI
jgi:hypothetical protein